MLKQTSSALGHGIELILFLAIGATLLWAYGLEFGSESPWIVFLPLLLVWTGAPWLINRNLGFRQGRKWGFLRYMVELSFLAPLIAALVQGPPYRVPFFFVLPFVILAFWVYLYLYVQVRAAIIAICREVKRGRMDIQSKRG